MVEALNRAARAEDDRRSIRSRSARSTARVPAGQSARRPGSERRGSLWAGAGNGAGDPVATIAQPGDERPYTSRARGPGTPGPSDRPRVDRTRVAPQRNPRRNVNPAARRRTLALLALVVAILVGMVVAAVLLAKPSKSAPPQIKVPRLAGERTANGRTVLRSIGLRARVIAVPAPGVTPGTVTRQAPAAATKLAPRSTVTLFVAEVPRWRTVTSFSGENDGQSVRFRIRGTHARTVYSMAYDGTCTLIFICSGPSAKVVNLGNPSQTAQFDLNEGQNQTKTYQSDAGLYQVTISAGDDNAKWSMTVQDWY
jgi:hypothetical protein